MTEIVVRPYRAEDFSQVVEIAVNLLVEDKEIEYWICLACESDRYELFVGEIDTKVVGLLMLELTVLLWPPHLKGGRSMLRHSCQFPKPT